MRNILHTYLFTTGLLLSLALQSVASPVYWLRLKMATGKTLSYIIPQRMTITEEGDSLILRSAKLEASFLKQSVEGYSFGIESDNADGIDAPTLADEVRLVYTDNERIVIDGLPETAEITIYTTNGVRQPARISRNGAMAMISLSGLPAGILLVNIKDITTIKVVKMGGR